ncbi:apolipoprotein A1/A4/E family protein, partial [Vibrio vulnificus]|uniref:apolipoprotein A1/A4/E family protein n=1 Tax=Vibrio vulnificus TaxID=672 RepID=UPI001CCA1CCA
NNYIRKLKKRLGKDSDEIQKTVATYLGELHSRSEQNAGAVMGQIEPFAKQVQDGLMEKFGALTEIMQNQAVNQQLEQQADMLKQQLEKTAEDLRTSLEGRIEELT